MDGRWIDLTSISGEGIESSVPLPSPSLFIFVNGRCKHTARPARTRRENPLRTNPLRTNPVWKSPVRIDLENEPDLVLEFDLVAKENLRYVRNRDLNFGEVNVPVNDLLAGGPHGSLRRVSCQVSSPTNRPNGTLSFSYRIHLPPPRHTYLPPPGSTFPTPVHVPTEVVAAILAMLPAKTLIKFRCVCKSWNSLVRDDPYFAAQHLNNPNKKSTSTSLTFTSVCTVWNHYPDAHALCYHAYDGSKARKIDFASISGNYCVTNSCNGLVGVYALDVLHVMNPSIMKLATLPRGCSPHVERLSCLMPLVGIGFESSTAVYKVVRLFVREYDGRNEPSSVGCEVFSLGGRSWKSVEDPPGPLRFMEHMVSVPCYVVEGAMYWRIPYGFGTGVKLEIALSFDLLEEKFSIILHPDRSSRPRRSSIVAVRGSLCIVDTVRDWKGMEIWTLKDRRSSEWVKQYSIDLSRMSRRIVQDMRPLTIDDKRIALVSYADIMYYDLMTMRLVYRFRCTNGNIHEVVRWYTESIIWPFCK